MSLLVRRVSIFNRGCTSVLSSRVVSAPASHSTTPKLCTLGSRLSATNRSMSAESKHAAGGFMDATAAAAAVEPKGALEYTTVTQPTRSETEVKKSKFLVTAWPVTSGKQALSLIKGASDPGATHNCWAYLVGGEYRSSDDGEPGGTAGKPILAAIEGEGLEGVAVLVTRHFGGTKLGVGGLVRAYGGAARECLRAAPKAVVKAKTQMTMRVGFDVLGPVYNVLDKFHCERLSEDYPNDSSDEVELVVLVESWRAKDLVLAACDATAGRVVAQPCSTQDDGEEVS